MGQGRRRPQVLFDPGDNDRKVTLAGIRLAIAIAKANALQPYLEDYKSDNEDDFFWPTSATDPDKLTDDQLMKFMVKALSRCTIRWERSQWVPTLKVGRRHQAASARCGWADGV